MVVPLDHGWIKRAQLLFLRQEAKYIKSRERTLHHQNLTSKQPVVAPEGPVVSLTTFRPRLDTVYLTIESIAAGNVLPLRLILWIQDAELFRNRPESIRRLEKRGLEVKLAETYGPHTKYYPYVESESHFRVPLVTADDDVLYSRWWLQGLMAAYINDDSVLSCYRAHKVRTQGSKLAPYKLWNACQSREASHLHFTTGVSGVLYPPAMLGHLKAAGKAFQSCCPRADDVWLNLHALRNGFKVKQVYSRQISFPLIAGSQASGLWHSNVIQDQNDVQIANTYTPADVQLLQPRSLPLSSKFKTSAV